VMGLANNLKEVVDHLRGLQEVSHV